MVETTENIVIRNNRISELSELMQASLLDMEANHKKLDLLDKERYSVYFEEATNQFERALAEAIVLSGSATDRKSSWHELEFSYLRHRLGLWDEQGVLPMGKSWVSEQIVSSWLEKISAAKTGNQNEIEQALKGLNESSRFSARNGLYGFCISILLSIIGVWFVSRSIFTPLTTLAAALQRISIDKRPKTISLKGGDEFNALASAYNNMSQQLFEEENLRNEFIATLSHEIRTPLSSIHESVNMITEEVFGPVNDKQQKFLNIASIEIQRIKKLLNHLLNVSILESNTRKQNSSQVNIKNMVVTCTDSFASFAEKKNVTIIINGNPENQTVYGVVEELQQVFFNIIGNALKFSKPHGRVVVSWTDDSNKKFVLFKVQDTGPGVGANDLTLIFSKYYRTKDVRDHLDGVGLGLAISKKIVTNYGGIIGVTNNNGPGCTFAFSLPAK